MAALSDVLQSIQWAGIPKLISKLYMYRATEITSALDALPVPSADFGEYKLAFGMIRERTGKEASPEQCAHWLRSSGQNALSNRIRGAVLRQQFVAHLDPHLLRDLERSFGSSLAQGVVQASSLSV